MTKLVGIAALLALAVFGAGCTGSPEAEDEEGEEEIVLTTEDELRAKPLDPNHLYARLKPSNKPRTVKATFSLPGWQGYPDVPNAFGCQWEPARFEMRIQLSKVTSDGVTVKIARLKYDTVMLPSVLWAFDSTGKEATTLYREADFRQGGKLGRRDPGDFDQILTNTMLKAAKNNGEGPTFDFRFSESRMFDIEDSTCARQVLLSLAVKK